jgi:hypothetical protein
MAQSVIRSAFAKGYGGQGCVTRLRCASAFAKASADKTARQVRDLALAVFCL